MPPASGHLREGAHSEGSLPVINQDAHPVGMGVHHQIRPTVSVEIGGRHARHIATQRFYPLRKRLLGDVLKVPVTPIAPQRGTATGGPEEHIQESVPIHVGQRDPRPVEQELVGEVSCSGNGVREGNTRPGGFEAQETHPTQWFLRSERCSHPAENQPNDPNAPRIQDGSTVEHGPGIHALEEQ